LYQTVWPPTVLPQSLTTSVAVITLIIFTVIIMVLTEQLDVQTEIFQK